MNVKLLRQFGERLLTPHGSQGHLRFESRRVVPAWSSAHRFSCSAAILAAVRQKLHLSTLFKNPEPALASKLSKPLFFRRVFCFCSESASFHTVCMVYAQRSAPKIPREYAVQNTLRKEKACRSDPIRRSGRLVARHALGSTTAT